LRDDRTRVYVAAAILLARLEAAENKKKLQN